MSLAEKIDKDLIQAMKSRDSEKTNVLRMLKTALTNYKIQSKKEILSEQEILDIIQKQHKQRKESIESFEKAGRIDLKEKEEKELIILQGYLPAALSEMELKQIISEAIHTTGAKSKQDLGRVMKEIMPRVKGRADGAALNQLITQILS